jgi:plastocyanin
MKFRGFLVGGVMALALVLTGCGGGSSSGGATGSGGSSGPVAITIGTDTGADQKFVPNTAEAPPNTPVKLTFQNKSSSLAHNLTFQGGISAQTNPSVAPGASEPISFTTPAAGTYQFVCTLHPGMNGTLTVK